MAPIRRGLSRRLAAAVPPARVELARLRLEDVFIRIVARRARPSSAAARALRAGLRAPGRKGHSYEKRLARGAP